MAAKFAAKSYDIDLCYLLKDQVGNVVAQNILGWTTFDKLGIICFYGYFMSIVVR